MTKRKVVPVMMNGPVDTVVYCNVRFVAFHRWPQAKKKGYPHLAISHRHEFHVRAGVSVYKDDREVEFQEMKLRLQGIINDLYSAHSTFKTPTSHSCEMMAHAIACRLESYGYDVYLVDVSEDGENGAIKLYV